MALNSVNPTTLINRCEKEEVKQMTRKMQEAIKQTTLGQFHRTATAITESIPEVVANELSVDALSSLLMAMHKHWQSAMAFAEAAACDEGCIWDAKQQKLREIAN
jgi:hypothetical protein